MEEIKSRIDIVELVQSYVRLQKAGVNFKGNCPFHSEKTPSFFVTPSRQIWHCFGCGLGGDIFKFVMQIEGHDFPEALRLLAQRAGVVLKREDPAIRSERNRLYDICEEAARIFEQNLAVTPEVSTYLRYRGVTPETIRAFRIGFAPASWNFLLTALAAKRFRPADAEKAGLAIRSPESGSWHDRFRSRIMFPITDAGGHVIGFGGRIFTSDSRVQSPESRVEAKYINTPQTLIYDKSRALYGFDKAKQAIRIQNKAVIVEGYMDCVMSHQAGIANTVAVSGTALTPQQMTMLKRLCETIVSSFDTDAAGESATRRSLALAAQFEFERLVIAIPSGKDPADTVLESPKAWRSAVEQAKPVVEFYFEKAFREHDVKTGAGKKAVAALLLPFVQEVPNEIEKAHWVGELAEGLGVPAASIQKELARRISLPGTADETQRNVADGPLVRVQSRRELLEERFLSLFAAASRETRLHHTQNHHMVFVSPVHEELFNGLLQEEGESAALSLHPVLATLQLKNELLAGELKHTPEEELAICRRELEKECIREELIRLGQEIQREEREKEGDHVAVLLQQFQTLSQTLRSLT
ncbi:MAG: DNA primase [Candidatus Sungbacteria bacterium]|nr:DNA primase [Candidatus Sungbacteria bacterium]